MDSVDGVGTVTRHTRHILISLTRIDQTHLQIYHTITA
jgi:hypothetical protein